MSDQKKPLRNERRENQRAAMVAHIAGSLLRAWGESMPDTRKLVLRSIYIADALLLGLDEIPEGEVDPTRI